MQQGFEREALLGPSLRVDADEVELSDSAAAEQPRDLVEVVAGMRSNCGRTWGLADAVKAGTSSSTTWRSAWPAAADVRCSGNCANGTTASARRRASDCLSGSSAGSAQGAIAKGRGETACACEELTMTAPSR